MNPIRGVAYITLVSFDKIRWKINHLLKLEEFHRTVESEQEKRHKEYQEYCKKYIECLERSRSE